MRYVDGRHGPGPLREIAYRDTVLAYLQRVLRQAAEEFPAALAE